MLLPCRYHFVYPRVSLPGRFVHPVAAAAVARLSEKTVAHFAQIAETNPLRIARHVGNGLVDLLHNSIINDIIVKNVIRKTSRFSP